MAHANLVAKFGPQFCVACTECFSAYAIDLRVQPVFSADWAAHIQEGINGCKAVIAVRVAITLGQLLHLAHCGIDGRIYVCLITHYLPQLIAC
jgi:hypothetical protein